MVHAFAPNDHLDLDDDIADDVDEVDDRRSVRVNVPFSARVISNDPPGSTKITGHLVNLSVDGAALRVYGMLKPRASLRLNIDVGRIPLVVSARAVWTRTLRHGPIVGVAFDELDDGQRAAIAALLTRKDK